MITHKVSSAISELDHIADGIENGSIKWQFTSFSQNIRVYILAIKNAKNISEIDAADKIFQKAFVDSFEWKSETTKRIGNLTNYIKLNWRMA